MKHIIELINQNTIKNNVHLTDEQLLRFSGDEINFIVKQFGGKRMIKLPLTEVNFFEWLKINDTNVWNDIWEDCSSDELYTVSIIFLPYILDKGFLICDLMKNDNYYFHIDNMVDAESKIIIDAARNRLKNNQKLTIAQLFVLEISIAPIDIWHFAYKYKINLNEVKKAVSELVEDDALVHLKEAEYLIPFLPY